MKLIKQFNKGLIISIIMLSMLPLNSFVPDYIGVIKENNKKVEKLESYIEKQQDGR